MSTEAGASSPRFSFLLPSMTQGLRAGLVHSLEFNQSILIFSNFWRLWKSQESLLIVPWLQSSQEISVMQTLFLSSPERLNDSHYRSQAVPPRDGPGARCILPLHSVRRILNSRCLLILRFVIVARHRRLHDFCWPLPLTFGSLCSGISSIGMDYRHQRSQASIR